MKREIVTEVYVDGIEDQMLLVKEVDLAMDMVDGRRKRIVVVILKEEVKQVKT